MRPEARRPDDSDMAEPSPYLRRSKRVEVRRSARWKRVLLVGAGIALLAGGALAMIVYSISSYLTFSPRFGLRDTLAVGGGEHVSREQVAGVFARDAGRSVFQIPLERRREELMALPWIRSAFVARGWPNRLRVQVGERTPVAFARTTPSGGKPGLLCLIDREGVLLPLPQRKNFQFPVLTGVSESQAQGERQRRVGVMLAVLEDLDRDKPPRGGEVSEVDLSDPDDAALTVSASGAAVLVHLGNSHFLERYRLFLENVEAWREQYGSVRSVDLRFEKQVVVKP